MLLDNFVLANSDVLIAARFSSFNQILPMRLVFDKGRNKKGPHFCEVSDTAKTMTCLEDISTWMFRDDANKKFTYALNSEVDEGEVVHRFMVQLPDVDAGNSEAFSKAQWYLNLTKEEGFFQRLKHEPSGGFNQKYRGDTTACDQHCTDFHFI